MRDLKRRYAINESALKTSPVQSLVCSQHANCDDERLRGAPESARRLTPPEMHYRLISELDRRPLSGIAWWQLSDRNEGGPSPKRYA